MKLNRGSPKLYDYWGCGAIGDKEYDGHVDKWENIKTAIQSAEQVPIVPNHQSDKVIGYVNHHELDNCNKKVYLGFNDDDITANIGDINNVSPQWKTSADEIVGINHWAVGNDFNQLCDDEICGIESRSEKMNDKDKEKEENDVPEEESEEPEEENEDKLSEDEETALTIADIVLKVLDDEELNEEEIEMVRDIFSGILDRGAPKDEELELSGVPEDKKSKPEEVQESTLGQFEYKNIKNY